MIVLVKTAKPTFNET